MIIWIRHFTLSARCCKRWLVQWTESLDVAWVYECRFHLWSPYVIRQTIYIFILSFVLSFFLALSQRSEIGCLPYFHTWCGVRANLGCRSEMCCTWLAGNAARKKSPSAHHRTTLSGYIFATKARINNRKKKLVKQQYLLQMSPQYGGLRPTSGWDRSGSLGNGHPS